MNDGSSQTRDKVFISYNRIDKKFLDELHFHLAFYVRTGLITSWDDTMIWPGSNWRKDIAHAVDTAKIAVFLVDANFFASDFIEKFELSPILKAAEQHNVTVFSVVLGPCIFNDTPLGKYQTINPPSSPLNMMSRGKRDGVWVALAKAIKSELELTAQDKM